MKCAPRQRLFGHLLACIGVYALIGLTAFNPSYCATPKIEISPETTIATLHPAVSGPELKATENVTIARDEISFYSSVMQLLAYFITVAAVIFGAIVGINVFQGHSILKEAREELRDLRTELDQIKEARKKYEAEFKALGVNAETIYRDTINKIQVEARKSLEEFVKREYGLTTVAQYKTRLLEELEKASPDEKQVFIHLTDIINYPDCDSLRIYSLCLEKLPNSNDVVRIVRKALNKAAEGLTGSAVMRKADDHMSIEKS